MTILRACALSNDIVASEAAEECLLSGGSAVAAVLSGFFAAAGAYSGVLLGPLSVLVAGVGVGARAFDGRLRQPGVGAKRPRGFREEDPIPPSAYVAVPGAIAAAAVALAYEGGGGFGGLVRHGIQRAERAGAEARAQLLTVVRGLGAQAFGDPAFVRPMLHVAGPSEGGLLMATDFASVPSNIDVIAQVHPENDLWQEVPWAPAMGEQSAGACDGSQYVVIAIDNRGVAAAASFLRAREGVAFETMELVAPRAAAPVRRGVARTNPGERLSCPASCAIKIEGGRPTAVVASPNVHRMDSSNLTAPELSIRRDAGTRRVIPERR